MPCNIRGCQSSPVWKAWCDSAILGPAFYCDSHAIEQEKSWPKWKYVGVGAEALEGRKNDDGKARWDLLPFQCLNEVVEVLMHGAAKYGDDNWEKVDNHRRRYWNAAMRHMLAWWGGERLDPESGKSHLAHAIASILFLMARDSK